MREALLAALPRALEDVVAVTGARLLQGSGLLRYDGVSIDSRTLRAGELFFAVAGPRFDGHDFVAEVARKGAAAAVVHHDVASPAGFPLVRVADTTAALADLARETRQRAALPVVAVTGSTGKTTTKDMAAALLAAKGPVLKTEGNLNNQYGLPLTLLRLEERHAAAVLELGMSAPGELRALSAIARPDVAVITKIAPVHLEFFPSLDAIADAKAEILEGLRPGGTAVLNGDDPLLVARGRAFPGRVVWFGRDRRFEVSAEGWRGNAFGMRFDLVIDGRKHDVALPLIGLHTVENFLAAAAAAWLLGMAPEAIATVAPSLRPARHRGEVLALGEGVTLIDDCYNSNPAAVEAALAALQLCRGQRRVAFLGEMLELGPSGPALHREAGVKAAGQLDLLVGVGALARELVEAAAGRIETRHCGDAAEAAAVARELVRPGDAVLVKGSRGVGLEAVVDALRARFRERR
jgi:UDP-N-acetylmuramoyl-tripeptide--D-alanyl-D-alanine ligase